MQKNDDLLVIDQLQKLYGSADSQVVALQNIQLSVNPGEFLTVVGPSGCGKSTFLQIIAGLMPATSGTVQLGQNIITNPPAGMVYLFQQYSNSLMPWRTVLGNVAFALEGNKGQSKQAIRDSCMQYLDMVGLIDFAQRYPWELSGGMQQRVAIARALAAQPKVLLLDEPFSAVDALTRLELHRLMLRIWEERGFTAILVTHDVDEAIFLSDRVAVLSKRPAVIEEVIDTNLPRPRDQIETPSLPRFLELRHYLLEHLLGRSRHG